MPCPNSEQYSLDKFSWCVYFCRFCYAWWVFTRSGINWWGQLGKWTGQKPFSRSSWFPYKTTHFFQPKKRNWKRHRWQQKNKKSEQKTKPVWKMCVEENLEICIPKTSKSIRKTIWSVENRLARWKTQNGHLQISNLYCNLYCNLFPAVAKV